MVKPLAVCCIINKKQNAAKKGQDWIKDSLKFSFHVSTMLLLLIILSHQAFALILS